MSPETATADIEGMDGLGRTSHPEDWTGPEFHLAGRLQEIIETVSRLVREKLAKRAIDPEVAEHMRLIRMEIAELEEMVPKKLKILRGRIRDLQRSFRGETNRYIVDGTLGGMHDLIRGLKESFGRIA